MVAISVVGSPRSSSSENIRGAKLCSPGSPALLAKISGSVFRSSGHGGVIGGHVGDLAGNQAAPHALDFIGSAERRIALPSPAKPHDVILGHAEILNAGLTRGLRTHATERLGKLEAARERGMGDVHVCPCLQRHLEYLKVSERLGQRRTRAAMHDRLGLSRRARLRGEHLHQLLILVVDRHRQPGPG